MDAHYYCALCETWGTGSACWCCGTTTGLVTSGPDVDNHVYGWPAQGSVHVMTHEKQP